jgi:hypothetical protein
MGDAEEKLFPVDDHYILTYNTDTLSQFTHLQSLLSTIFGAELHHLGTKGRKIIFLAQGCTVSELLAPESER